LRPRCAPKRVDQRALDISHVTLAHVAAVADPRRRGRYCCTVMRMVSGTPPTPFASESL
jgi:hypothetical protein